MVAWINSEFASLGGRYMEPSYLIMKMGTLDEQNAGAPEKQRSKRLSPTMKFSQITSWVPKQVGRHHIWLPNLLFIS